jgi:pyruvate kinase
MNADDPSANSPSEIASLYEQLSALIDAVRTEGDAQAKTWAGSIVRPGFAGSTQNLAQYMALRRRDLRALQRSLSALGLSSLGRLESRVMPTLTATKAALAALGGMPTQARPSTGEFFAGDQTLAHCKQALFGASSDAKRTAVLVTCPSEAARDATFMLALAERGVEALRINCAHDDAAHWARMIEHARAAETAKNHSFRIFMDLAGPKIRTGAVRHPHGAKRATAGCLLVITPTGGLDRIDIAEDHFATECTLAEALSAASVGDRVFVDDGKLAATIERVETWGVVARVVAADVDGVKIKSEKGLNFPDTKMNIPALTEKDLDDLKFVAAQADGIEFSFVQSAADVKMLQVALAEHRPGDWQEMAIILKIETATAVRNLPDIVVQAAGSQPTAIMIARGDLAVEIGFARMAEIQEEILWIGEAAHVPVIWATQVLEHLVQKGTPSRGEMTDAAMAARADCVMLNKGPYLLVAIDLLQTLLARMDEHQHKKTPQLRRLRSW